MNRTYSVFILLAISGSLTFGVAAGTGSLAVFEADGPILQVPSCSELNLRDELTLEAWIRPERFDRAGVRLIDKSRAGTQSGYMLDTFPATR